MFQLKPTLLVTAILLLTVSLYCSVACASDSAFSETPIEQGDVTTIDEMNQGASDVFAATPDEQEDVKTIDEMDEGGSDVFEATPAEQDDIKTIDQLNNE